MQHCLFSFGWFCPSVTLLPAPFSLSLFFLRALFQGFTFEKRRLCCYAGSSAGSRMFIASDLLYTTLASAFILNAFGFETYDNLLVLSALDVLLYKVSNAKLFGMLLSLTSYQQTKKKKKSAECFQHQQSELELSNEAALSLCIFILCFKYLVLVKRWP